MGELLALASGFCFAVSNVCIVRGAPRGATDNGAFLSLLLTAVIAGCGWLINSALHGFAPVTAKGIAWLCGAGILTGFVGRVFLYTSVQRLGAVGGSALKRLNPMFAMVLGILVLGETITGWGLVGAVLVVASILLLMQSQLSGAQPAERTGGGLWQRVRNVGYFYGVVSALGYAFGYLLRKAGLHEAPDPFFGASLGCLVGALLYMAVAPFNAGYRDAVAATFKGSNRWLLAAGVASSFGQILYFAALNVSSMSRVALLVSLEVFMTMGITMLVYGERVAARVALAAALGFVGAGLLAGGSAVTDMFQGKEHSSVSRKTPL
jgi:drug/metabolite transporter (DMT)-like permease